MKKLNKLFAILFAVLGVTTLKAQTDVTDQYLTNADFENSPIFDGTSLGKSGTNASPTSGSTLISGATNVYEISGWTNMTTEKSDFARVFTMPYNTTLYVKSNGANGGQAVVAPANGSSIKENNSSLLFVEANWCPNATLGIKQDVTLPAGVYELNFDSYVTTNIQNGTSLCGVQVGSTQIYKWPTATDTWTNNSITFALTSEQSVTISMGYKKSSDVGGGLSPFLFVDNIRLLHKPFTDVTESDPVDLTSKVSNTKETWAGASETPAYDGVTMVAVYKGSDWIGDALSQTVNGLPAGNYKMEAYCQAHSAWDTDAAAEGATGYTYLCANEYKLDVPIRNADKATTKQLHTFEKISITDGSLKISVVNEKLAANWISVYVKSLTFLGPDKSLEEESFNSNIEALNALNAENVPTAFAAEINNMISTYGDLNASEMKLAELFTANEEIRKFIATYNILADLYANLKSLITTCESIKENSAEAMNGAKATFTNVIKAVTANVETATTADAINEQYNTLKEAKNIYVKNADPTNDTYFDYTFLITNPGFDNGKTGWESTGGAQNKAIATNKANGIITGTFFENWNPSNFTGEIYQTISNLPSGIYKLKVAAYGAGTNVYANDKQTAVTTGDGAWYEVDQVIVGDGTLKFGIKNENATTWMGIDNASIYYYGFDVATAQASVSELKAKAEAIVTEAKPMNADIATALNAAIADADATKTTRNELSPMIDALSSAVADAETSIAAYEAINRYIIKANGIGESIAAEYLEQYENGTLTTAEPVFQALEVATYSYVTTEFSYPVELSGEWTTEGPVGELSDQHWSGEKRTYMEQSGAAWGWDAWSISYDQDLTLPAGEYVFKVAGRKAAGDGCTLELIVTKEGTTLGTVNDFPEGDTGRGIETNGTANFSEEGTYVDVIKDGQIVQANGGRGWQWRYVKFTLDSEATVNIAVKAEATTNHQWISFCDATVQMTEETYLAANMHGLDAPTAAAEALVGTKPMGTAENDALQAALDMPVTTGAELQAKITALEAAVANANAWVAAYNEAKAPLVAALERFEADFNLGDGLHGYMKNGLWANVLDQVQAAAVAKDDTDSYEGFADAADNLNTALDAAQASINMYANLAAEISYAEAYSPVVTENTDGHTAAIEVAQAAYDAAEIDDASALILGMQNYRALDYIHVTENYTEEVKLGEWTGKTNSNKGEHWSGDANKTYFDYSKWASGYTNGANEATQTITLPAGKYVLMAAGRAATVAGTEAYIKVNGTKVNFPAKGSYGYGIATDGTANYAAEGTYGRDNEGYGWEYRFITFTLTKESEVTLTAGMTIDVNTADLSWAGVCAPVLYKQGATQVDLTISAVEWATLILPFDAELPDGVKAYSCGKVDGDALVLEEAANFVANTPYLVNGAEGTYSFEGYSIAEEDSYTVGLFTGTYVDYQTEVGTNTYVLQKNNNGGAAFYLVGDARPWVRAYRCYMTYKDAAGAPMFSISRGEDTTGIENSTLNAPSTVIYDLMGRKVTNMVKGNMYIVNGKKVVIK